MKNTPVELPFVVSVRFSDPDFRRLVVLANTGRRTLSQTLRLLLEPVLHTPQKAA